MLISLLLGTVLTAPAAPVPRDTDPPPAGPAPHVIYLKADFTGRVNVQVYQTQKVTQARTVNTVENGKPVSRVVREQVEQTASMYVSLADIKAKFTTADGVALTTEAVMRRAKDGLVVLVSADGKPVEKAWLRALDPGAVIASAEVLVGVGAPRPTVPVPTQAPRLVVLGTGTDGKVQVAYNPNPGGVFHPGRAEMPGFINPGAGARPAFRESYLSNPIPTPTIGTAPVKALADVKFDAYDLSGKLVDKADALKRLTAGGLVVIAGDNRLPDAQYLKMFRGDLLVLVSPELANVPTGAKGKPAPKPIEKSR